MPRFGSNCALRIASCSSSSSVRAAEAGAEERVGTGPGAGAVVSAGAGAGAGAVTGVSAARGGGGGGDVGLGLSEPGLRVAPKALGLKRGQGAFAELSSRRGFCRSRGGVPLRMRSRSIDLVPDTGRPRRRSCCRSSETVNSSSLRV